MEVLLMKIIKNSFIALLLLSYAATAISMDQSSPSLWNRFKNWVKPSQKFFLHAGRLKTANLLLGNGYFVGRSIFDAFSGQNLRSSSLADLQKYIEAIPVRGETKTSFLEMGKRIENVCKKAQVPDETKVSFEEYIDGPAQVVNNNHLQVQPLLLRLFTPEEQDQIIAHECMHIKNQDGKIGKAADFIAPILSWGILSSSQKVFNYGLDGITKSTKSSILINRLKLANNILTQNFISYFALNSLLTSLVSRKIESRADKGAGLLLNETEHAISMHKKVMNPEFKKKMYEILKINIDNDSKPSLLMRIIDHPLFSSHPSSEERIKAFEDLQKQIDKK